MSDSSQNGEAPNKRDPVPSRPPFRERIQKELDFWGPSLLAALLVWWDAKTADRPSPPYAMRAFLVFSWFGIAMVLRDFRDRKRRLYGGLEIAAGVGLAWIASRRFGASRSADPLIEIMAIVGALFVMIRGLDNFHQGRTARARKQP